MQVISASDFKPRLIDTPEGQFRIVDIIGRNGQLAPGPQCFLTETRSMGMTVRPHFHKVEQFQVFVGGSGYFGKKAIPEPTLIHYADRFTPYGPIKPDGVGFQYMTLRLKADPGPRPMPAARSEKTEPTGRSLTCECRTMELPITESARTDLIANQTDGLTVRLLKCPANQEIAGVNPTDNPGQYYIVIDGAVIRDGREFPRLSTFFVKPGDEGPNFVAGHDGVALLLAAFPNGAVSE
jgi:hypothetical protein